MFPTRYTRKMSRRNYMWRQSCEKTKCSQTMRNTRGVLGDTMSLHIDWFTDTLDIKCCSVSHKSSNRYGIKTCNL